MLDVVPLLISAFIIGLLGGGHCIGMCGGLMGALALAIPKEQQHKKLLYLILYNLGRIISYAAAGFIFGLAGWAVDQSPAADALRIIAALLLISMGLYLANWWSGLVKIEQGGQVLWRHLRPIAQRYIPIQKSSHALSLGLLWGWLPCGLVYSTVIWSASQGDASLSALLMLFFGLGTWPTLIASGFAAERLTHFLRSRNVRSAAGLMIILYGIWTFPGPPHHWLIEH